MPSRVLALSCALLALSGCGGGASRGEQPSDAGSDLAAAPLDPSRTRPLSDPDYETAVPAGWHQRDVRSDGQRLHFLNSGSGHANDLGLAGPGQVGLTVAIQRSSDLPSSASAEDALARIAATPDGATGVTREPVSALRLDGAQAAATRFKYTYEGRDYVQRNVVAVANGVVVFIEVDASPEEETQARRTLATVVANWQWSERAAVVPS